MSAAVVLVRNEFAVPSQQGFRRDNGCQFRQDLSCEQPGFAGQTATLIVGEAKPPVAELSTQDSIFLVQILESRIVVADSSIPQRQSIENVTDPTSSASFQHLSSQLARHTFKLFEFLDISGKSLKEQNLS